MHNQNFRSALPLSSDATMDLIDKPNSTKEFLFLSDFDQTLSFQDSGHVLSEALAIPNFHEKVTSLAKKHLVQQGGELAPSSTVGAGPREVSH
jgi:hypothetical protein